MARWIKTDGTESQVAPANKVEFTLEEMNTFVSGYLEAIKLTPSQVMYFNEEGIRLQLPVNHLATQVLRQHRAEHATTVIVGNVLIASLKETGDEE